MWQRDRQAPLTTSLPASAVGFRAPLAAPLCQSATPIAPGNITIQRQRTVLQYDTRAALLRTAD